MQMENGGSIYGKTGTGTDGEAWFVGFEERVIEMYILQSI